MNDQQMQLSDLRARGPLGETAAMRCLAAILAQLDGPHGRLAMASIGWLDEAPVIPPPDPAAVDPLADLIALGSLLDELLDDQVEPSSVVTIIIGAAKGAGAMGGYSSHEQMAADVTAALAGLPLLHAIGAQGRLADLETITDVEATKLLISQGQASIKAKQYQAMKPIVIAMAVAVLVIWFAWLIQFLRAGIGDWAPAWASTIGVDDHGRWAVVELGEERLRFRLVTRGDRPRAGDLWVMDRELSRSTWRAVAPLHEEGLEDLALPVNGITHREAEGFCRQLNALITDMTCRLPRRDEWAWVAGRQKDAMGGVEVVCARGQLLTQWKTVRDPAAIMAWWKGLPWKRRTPLGPAVLEKDDRLRFHAGIADLVGNVAELCADPDPGLGGKLVAAGGSWFDPPEHCGVGTRFTLTAEQRDARVGLRLVIDYHPPGATE